MKYSVHNLFLGTSILSAAISCYIVAFAAGLGYRISQSEQYYIDAAGTSLVGIGARLVAYLIAALLATALFYLYPCFRQRPSIIGPYHALPLVFLIPGLIIGTLLIRAALTYGLTL